MKAEIDQITISFGRNQFRFNKSSNIWQVLIWGWTPYGGSTPHYSWMVIDENRVPEEVKNKVL